MGKGALVWQGNISVLRSQPPTNTNTCTSPDLNQIEEKINQISFMLQENHWFLQFCCRKTSDLPLTNSCKWEKKILWLFPLCSRRKTIDLHYFSISRSTNAEEWCIKAMIHKTEPLIQYCFFYSVIFVSLVGRFFSLADIICLFVTRAKLIEGLPRSLTSFKLFPLKAYVRLFW